LKSVYRKPTICSEFAGSVRNFYKEKRSIFPIFVVLEILKIREDITRLHLTFASMKKAALLLLLAVIGFSGKISAQLTGVVTVPGTYPTLAAAITALNTSGVGAGGVVINHLAGFPETAPAGGYQITTNTSTAANPVAIVGNGNTITASGTLTAGALNDGIFKIIGADYIGIQGYVMQENPANTITTPATNNMTEWGVALLHASVTNGAQGCVILGNTISLNRTYSNTWGIYSNSRHSATNISAANDPTAVTGANSNNSVFQNSISNVNMGIAFIGSSNAVYMDLNNVIGSATMGNVLTSWGGMIPASTYLSNSNICYGILMNHQINVTVRGNTISTAITPAATFRGISQVYTVTAPTTASNNKICANTISLQSAAASGAMQAIVAGNGSTNTTLTLDSNLIQNCAVTNPVSTTTFVGMSILNSLASVQVRMNRILNTTSATNAGGFTGIQMTASINGNSGITDNQIGNASNDAITFSAATGSNVTGIAFTGTASAGAGLAISANIFQGFVFNTTASSNVEMITHTGTCNFNFINNNEFRNLNLNTTGNVTLINHDMVGGASSVSTVTTNSIVGSLTKSAAGGTVTCISGLGASAAGARRTIQDNIFSNITVTGSTLYGLRETGGAATGAVERSIVSNTFANWTGASTATCIEIDRSGTNTAASSNIISSVSATNCFGIRFLSGCNGTPGIFSNSITGFTSTAIATMIQFSGAPVFTSVEVGSNVLGNATSGSTTSGPIGIDFNCSGPFNVHDNVIYDLNGTSNTANATCAIYGIFAGAASSVHANKIYDIENISSTGGATGIYISNCSVLNIYNNYIGDIRAGMTNGNAGVVGLDVAAGTTVNISYNTIYLTNVGAGTNSGSTGLRTATGPATTLRNNLIVNLSSATGSGVVVAYTRTTTALGTYDNASNNNAFYSGTPSAANLIFFDGTNSDQTLAAFQTRVGPTRDALSVTENPTFSSTNGNDPDYLHIPAATASLLESGGTTVAGIAVDRDLDDRPGPIGSVNGGAVAPDIGADEFDGIMAGCSGTPTAGTAITTSPASQCAGNTFDLELTGHSTGTAFTYQWQESSVSGGPYTNIAGATADTYTTVALSNTMYYVCVVTCTVSGMSATSTEQACTIYATPVLTFTPAAPALCAGGSPVNVAASGANSYAWLPVAGLSNPAIPNPDANPASTTTYTVTGTSVDGCTGSNTVTVTVNPLPTVGASASPDPLCAGGTVTLTASGADTYIWQPMFTSGNPITDNPAATTTYTVTGTDANGCTNTAMVTVTVVSTPTVTATADFTTICGGDPVQLTGGGATTYLWNPGAISGSPVTVNPASTTTYTVVGTDGNGCTGTDMVTITVNPAPAVSATANPTTICAGDVVFLDGFGATTYNWMPGSLSGSSVTDTPASTTTYTVTGTDGAGCTGTATVMVTVNPLPAVVASPAAVSICDGDNTSLSASGASTYMWFPGFLVGSPVTVSPASTTTYTVVGTDGNGCTAQATSVVTVNPLPTVTASASPSTTCAGDPTTLTGSGASTYLWMPGSLSGASVVDNPMSSVTYTVTGTDVNGCTGTANTSVTVNPLPTVGASATFTSICAGSSTTLMGSGADTYVWMPGSLPGANVVVSPAATTTYTVTGTDMTTGCTNTATITITVNPLPVVTISGAGSYCQGGSTVLTSSAGTTYQWYLNGVLIAGETAQTITASAAGMYNVIVSLPTGCADSAATGHALTEDPAPSVSFTATPSLTVCAGSSLTLSGTGAVTYNWTGGIFDGVSFTPAVSADYTVTGTDALGCTNTAVASVTVTPGPSVTASASSSTICDGSFTMLMASGANTYLWMPGSLPGANVIVSPTATTTYTVTGTDVSGCTNTATITITVNPRPTVTISGAGSYCEFGSTVLTSSAGTTYQWYLNGVQIGGETSQTLTANAPGIYNVMVSLPTGCADSAATGHTLTENPAPTVAFTATPSLAVCAGSSLTLSGGGAVTYNWTGGIFDGVAFTPAVSGDYTVTGTDALGCTNTAVASVTVIPVPTVSTIASPGTTVCAESSVTLNGSGAVTYTWSGGVTDGMPFTISATTTYTVIGTDINGCTDSETVTITVNPTPTVTITASPGTTVCAGTAVTLSGGGAATYSWTGGVVDGVPFTPATTSSYTVTGTDASGCQNSASVTITVNPAPTVGFTAAPGTTICAGQNVTLNGTGTTSYSWSGGIFNGVPFTPASTTTYTVTGTNVAGCTGTATVTITVNPVPTVSASAAPSATVCSGGSLALSGSGAVSYTWSGGVTDGVSFVPPATATYTVTGTDVNGCTNTATILVTVNPLPTVGATASPGTAVCTGSSVTLNGTGAVTYTWSGGVTDGVAFVPPSTTSYVVTGTDGSGCTNTATITITVNPLPTVSSTTNPAGTVCAGTMVTLSGTGATSYVWTGGVSDGVPFAAMSTQTYTVTGTDGNGCTNTATTTVTVNPAPSVTASASPGTSVCTGSSVTLTGGGATTYTWTGGVTDGVPFTPVSTNTYTVTGSDAIGCTNTATITITVNPQPNISSTASPGVTVCAGTAVTLNGTGGSTYTWTGGVTNGVAFTPASTQTYTVTGTDINGCTNTATTTITVVPAPTITAGASPSTLVCEGTMVTLNGFGGSSYSWSGGVTDGVPFAAMATTTYTVIGTDGNGCTGTTTITINVNLAPNISAAQSPGGPHCAGSTVTLNGIGGISYTWCCGVTDGVGFVPASTATYTVTGSDFGGCTNTATITVVVNPLPTVSSTASPGTTVCTGTAVTLNGTGATTYTWTGGVTNGVPFTPVSTTTYTVTGTDANGCTNTATTTITVNPAPTVSSTASPSNAVCAGSSVTLNGTGALTYTWTGGVTDGVAFTPVSTATYTVTGTAANGCTATATTTVTVNPLPTVSSNTSPAPLVCSGTQVTLSGTGATTYIWTGGVTNNVPFTAVATNTYTVTGTDANGCTNTATTTVTVNTSPTVSYNASPSASVCVGTEITLDGTGAITYTWSDGIIDGNPFTPVATDTVTVIGTDGNGCEDTATVIITVNTPPVVTTAFSPNDTVCENAMLTLMGAGATTYAWSHGVTDNVAFPATVTTTYTVIGTDGNGCSDTTTQDITVIAAPVVTITGNSTFCTGGSTMLTSSAGMTYQWFMNGSPIVGATSPAYSATAAGWYNVWVTNSNGCGDSSATAVNVTINAVPTVTANSTATSVCEGSNVTLSGSGAVSYAWSAGVNDNVPFTPLSTLTYTVVGTASNGCTDSDTITVTVNPLPVVSTSGFPAYNVCEGTSVILNGNGAATYAWTGGVVDGVPFTPTVTDTYTVTGTDLIGCSNTATVTVTVYVNPVVNLGPDSAQCGAIMLDAGNAGSTYMWNTSATTQTINAVVSGTYMVDVTSVDGCTSSDTVVLTINTQPVVVLGADDTLCTASVTLDAQNAGGTYIWNDMSTGQTNVVTTSGTYFVEVTMPGGCVASDTINLVLHTPPSVSLTLPIDTACLNMGSVALSGESPAGGTWSGPAVSGSSFDPMIAGIGTFGITYMYTDTNGCSGSVVDSILVDPCLAIVEPVVTIGFNMYPNPNNGEFSITVDGNETVQVLIYNGAGQLVIDQQVYGGEITPVSLEASGIYMVTVITSDGQQLTKKVIVNR
jgi:hypothetical protein